MRGLDYVQVHVSMYLSHILLKKTPRSKTWMSDGCLALI